MADTEFRGLVVGYDGSAHSEAAVDWAAMEARRRGTGLTVLFAADSPGLPAGPALPIPDLLEWAREVAQGGAVRARKAEVDVEIVARSGSPARALVEASMTAELVVTGSRGHGGLAGALLGSVAFSVTAHAHCPAVVVRGDESTLAGPDHPVVVGIDGSPASQAALHFAADAAARSAATLTVVTAWHSSIRDSWGDDYRSAIDPSGPPEQAARQAAEQVAHTAVTAARNDHPQVAVESRVVNGRPGQALANASEGASLLVVGARGRGGFTSLLLGSVSHTVIHSAACPVAVIHS